MSEQVKQVNEADLIATCRLCKEGVKHIHHIPRESDDAVSTEE